MVWAWTVVAPMLPLIGGALVAIHHRNHELGSASSREITP